jgi:hypothetical protein
MEISILGSKKTLHIVESLLYSQPSCGIIRTTADYFLLPYIHECLSLFVIILICGHLKLGGAIIFGQTVFFCCCWACSRRWPGVLYESVAHFRLVTAALVTFKVRRHSFLICFVA